MSANTDLDDYWTQIYSVPETPSEPHLNIEIIEGIEPLDEQFGVADPKTVPDALYGPLFRQPEPTEDELVQAGGLPTKVPPLHTYAILDAAKVPDLPELLAASGLENRCLFKGEVFDELKGVAPWVVRLEDGNSFTRNLFTRSDAGWHLWDKQPGIYLRSRETLDELWVHFRKFTKVKDEQGKWFFFRFWDVVTARVYFPGIAARHERIDRLFRPKPTTTLEIIAPSGTDALRLYPRKAQGPANSIQPIVFDGADHALMQQIATQAFNAETAHWLRDAYPDRFDAFDERQMDAAIVHIMTEGTRVSCDLKDDYAYLAHVMLTLGGWFARTGHPSALTDILVDGQGSLRARLSRAFLPAFEASPQAALMKQWDDVKAHLTALPPTAQITPHELGTFTARFLKSHSGGVAAALAATKRDLPGLNLSIHDQGRLLVLTLIYGYQFYADPLRVWRDLPVSEAIDAAWVETLG